MNYSYLAIWSDMAQARPNPSYVEVSLSSSSINTSEEAVAVDRMLWVSTILAMKVEIPST